MLQLNKWNKNKVVGWGQFVLVDTSLWSFLQKETWIVSDFWKSSVPHYNFVDLLLKPRLAFSKS